MSSNVGSLMAHLRRSADLPQPLDFLPGAAAKLWQRPLDPRAHPVSRPATPGLDPEQHNRRQGPAQAVRQRQGGGHAKAVRGRPVPAVDARVGPLEAVDRPGGRAAASLPSTFFSSLVMARFTPAIHCQA